MVKCPDTEKNETARLERNLGDLTAEDHNIIKAIEDTQIREFSTIIICSYDEKAVIAYIFKKSQERPRELHPVTLAA